MGHIYKAINITKFGDPLKVLNLVKGELSSTLPPKHVLLKHLAAPINPADINMIQGVYGYKPKLPGPAGLEGSAQVVSIGSGVERLHIDDVVVFVGSSGSWQTHSIIDEDSLLKVDKNLDPFTSAQIKVNPCTAYRMLKDFVQLKPGDSFMQNGANSAVGIYAIQLAKIWGFKSINVIRDRPNVEEVISELKSFGADHVITESALHQQEEMSKIFQQVPKPSLVLDCVFGQNAVDCMRYAAHGARCVTYGAMSRKPLGVVSPGALIFKNHSYSGYWMSRWYEDNLKSNRKAVDDMIGELCLLFNQGKLKPKSHQAVKLDDYNMAIEALSQGFANKKYIFDMPSSY